MIWGMTLGTHQQLGCLAPPFEAGLVSSEKSEEMPGKPKSIRVLEWEIRHKTGHKKLVTRIRSQKPQLTFSIRTRNQTHSVNSICMCVLHRFLVLSFWEGNMERLTLATKKTPRRIGKGLLLNTTVRTPVAAETTPFRLEISTCRVEQPSLGSQRTLTNGNTQAKVRHTERAPHSTTVTRDP